MPSKKVVVTCALTGVLTDPEVFPVPVTPTQMANAAEQAFNAGATIVHVHLRDQQPGRGQLPSWEPDLAAAICDAIRARVPQLLINLTTGVVGDDISGPLACLARVKPEAAAMNAGSLNYLKTRSDGQWAWPPLLFDNAVPKIQQYLDAMATHGIVPEFECFDTGIVRSVSLFQANGMVDLPLFISLVMGVASGMPAKPDWLPLLVEELPDAAHWQVIAIGRANVWELHRRCLELGGNVRTGLEDTFYLPDGDRASCNGQLVQALVSLARDTGREPTTAAETRALYGL